MVDDTYHYYIIHYRNFIDRYPAEIIADDNGCCVYVSNRDATTQGRDSVVTFTLQPADSTLTLTSHVFVGSYPRSMAFTDAAKAADSAAKDATAQRTMLVAAQRGNSVEGFVVGAKGEMVSIESMQVNLPDSAAFVAIHDLSPASGGLSAGATAGIVISACLGIGLLAVGAYRWSKRRSTGGGLRGGLLNGAGGGGNTANAPAVEYRDL